MRWHDKSVMTSLRDVTHPRLPKLKINEDCEGFQNCEVSLNVNEAPSDI